MTTDVATSGVEVRIAFLVKLWSRVNIIIGVRSIDHATNAVTTVITAIIPVIAGRMAVLMFIIFGHAFDNGAEHGSGDDPTDVVTAMVIPTCTAIGHAIECHS